ncbi:venom allergen 5 [Lepeophtheirus salmonis]|uniref:venom allergen 5 n=1 Tax=Lepeophtheirus salmonis TaxID=72036 RepID=UPI001AE8062A|nr:venom allergen 5-like [Lepeophtheirus salmonis]
MNLSWVGLLTLIGFPFVFGICKSRFGTNCMTIDDPGARVYFAYFNWNSTCFAYQDGHYCMINLGYLQPCDCSQDCGCKESKENVEIEDLKCDSSSVKDYRGCENIKKIFCPLTAKSNGQTYPNTLCQYCGENRQICGGQICDSDILTQGDKDDILKIHNDFRSKVARGEEHRGVGGSQPPAANMNRLTWDDNLALSAQMWALQCPNAHDKNRLTPEFHDHPYVWVGQNLAFLWSSVKSSNRNYEDMIKGWYNEVSDFPSKNVKNYSNAGAKGVVGHYTTMIWGSTKKIGCGFVHHYDRTQLNNPYKKTLVCNYGKGGNILGQEVYQIGKPGSKCPKGNEKGLCL